VDALTVLRRARQAGLTIAADGDKLVVRGPKCAEPIVWLIAAHKPEVIVALDEATGWPARHREALEHWDALHPADEAAQLAWGELQIQWNKLHGIRLPEWQCDGCGEPIGGVPALDLGDGSRVHFDRLDCVIRYGERWRGAATRALVAKGLRPPAGENAA
jgi:hypothetical protein